MLSSVLPFGCNRPASPGWAPSTRASALQTPHTLELRRDVALIVLHGLPSTATRQRIDLADIERRWNTFRPDLLLIEHGEQPAATSPAAAIACDGLSGFVCSLALRDGVPIDSLGLTRDEEAAALLTRFEAADVKLLYVLREVIADTHRPLEYRAPSPESCVETALAKLSAIPGLEGQPTTLAQFEAQFRRRLPRIADWRRTPQSAIEPGVAADATLTNRIADAARAAHQGPIMGDLTNAAARGRRVLCITDSQRVSQLQPFLPKLFDTVTVLDWRLDLLPPAPGSFSPQVRSLLGTPLDAPPIPPARLAELIPKLEDLQARTAQPAATEDDFIWHGRTLAYLHRYAEAIDVYTRGLRAYPDSHRLLRHRGHRFITTRQLPLAHDDLAAAVDIIERNAIPDEIEPDGAPNRLGIPRSTTNTNIYYHLGLCLYLQGDFARAAASFQKCLDIAPNDDMTVAAASWLYLSLRRDNTNGDTALTPIHDRMQIMENDAYFRLCRMYQGVLTPAQVLPADPSDLLSSATARYGIAAWHAAAGRHDESVTILTALVALPTWPAFGVIAAEADLARLQSSRK